MSKMRAQSSSGATGLGSMNNEERKMLENAAGSLDTRKPLQLLKTLMMMRKSFPAILERQQKKFQKGFGSILGGEPEAPDATKTNIPNTPRGQENGQKPGVISLLTYGDGENEPPQLPATVTPTTVTPTTVTPTTVTPTTVTLANPEIATAITKLNKSVKAKIVNGIIDLAEGMSFSNLRKEGPLANKLWDEIEDEFKNNPSDEVLKALFDKYNLPYPKG